MSPESNGSVAPVEIPLEESVYPEQIEQYEQIEQGCLLDDMVLTKEQCIEALGLDGYREYVRRQEKQCPLLTAPMNGSLLNGYVGGWAVNSQVHIDTVLSI